MGTESLFHLQSAPDVPGEARCVGNQAAEVNDVSDPGPSCASGEIIGDDQVQVREGPLGQSCR